MGEIFRLDRLRGVGPTSGRNNNIDRHREEYRATDPELARRRSDDAVRVLRNAEPSADQRYENPQIGLDQSLDDVVEMPAVSAWPDDLPPKMLTELEGGTYHVGTFLESFAVRWPLEKCVRDVWQNFFDANGYSLTDITPIITESDGVYTIRIEGEAVYDPRKLLHVGGTGKQGDKRAAGGFGEGSAVSSFVLLRDFGVDTIDFESVGWKLNFALRTVEQGRATDRERGFFAHLQHEDHRETGNAIIMTTRDPKLVEAIRNGRELFYYEGHPDFTNPLFENEFGGLKLVPKEKGSYSDPKGHLYDAGQRRHYDKVETWTTLEWMNFWTKQKTLPSDRDRGKATMNEVKEHMVDPFVESLDFQQAEALLYKLEPMWDQGRSYEPVVHLLNQLCKKLKAAGRQLSFPENCVATNLVNLRIAEIMRQSGHRLCHNSLAEVGMKKQSERWQELQSHLRIEATAEHVRRIDVLQQAARLLGKTAKEIWLFDSSTMNNVLRGQYGGEQHVWLTDKEITDRPFFEAMATYLHELDHEHGNDGSAEFTDALTKTLGQVIQSQIQHPAEWKALADQWAVAA